MHSYYLSHKHSVNKEAHGSHNVCCHIFCYTSTTTLEYHAVTVLYSNWRIDNPFVRPTEMTFFPKKAGNYITSWRKMSFGPIRRLNLFCIVGYALMQCSFLHLTEHQMSSSVTLIDVTLTVPTQMRLTCSRYMWQCLSEYTVHCHWRNNDKYLEMSGPATHQLYK